MPPPRGMGSLDYRETFGAAARAVAEYRLGYVHVMDGLAFGFHKHGTPMTLKDIRAVVQEVQGIVWDREGVPNSGTRGVEAWGFGGCLACLPYQEQRFPPVCGTHLDFVLLDVSGISGTYRIAYVAPRR